MWREPRVPAGEGRTAGQHGEPPRAFSGTGQLLPSWLRPPSCYQPLWTTGGVTPTPAYDLGPLQSSWALERGLSGLPPAALKVTSGHRHPEHAPSDDIALGAGPSRAPAMGRHHPEMVTAANAASCGSQARGLQPASPVPPSPVSFHPTWGLAMGGALPKLELLILSREPSISPCCLCLRLGPHQGS